MEKTINIGERSVRLNNNVGWTMIYRDQFGKDIIPSIMPMLAGALDVVAGIIGTTGKTDEITLDDFAAIADGDALLNAAIHIGALEFTDLVNITWAMAKNCDDSIPEPREWVKNFESFPVDVIAPAVFGLAFKGMVSEKNLQRLNNLKKRVQPLTSKISSSQESSED